MARQVPFTEHEAALLLDAYLKVLSGERLRMDAVQECSSMLRQMAINVGTEIDDVYRNVNGISFQMASMESAYQGHTIMKPATRLFADMVLLYRINANQYQKLLKEAKDMANIKQNNEAMFMSWLSENVSKAQFSELYLALSEIEQQARKTKLVQASLYESFDPVLIKNIKTTVESSKIFKFMHKRQWNRIISALNFLMKFANQKSAEAKKEIETLKTAVSETKGEFTEIPNLPNVSENGNDIEVMFGKAEEKIAEIKMAPDVFSTVNFEAVTSMTFSTPVSLSYFGEVKQESSWESLYVDACQLLLDDYPNVFFRLKEEGLTRAEKIWIVDEQHLNLLTAPEKIDDTFFVETDRCASDFVKNLKLILDECAVDYENMVITYIKKAEKSQAWTEKSETSFSQKQYYRKDKENFYRWLKDDQQMAEATCRSYVSAIRGAERFAEEHALSFKKLYTNDVEEAQNTADILFANPEFIRHNINQRNRFRAAITKLMIFYGNSWSPVEAAMVSSDLRGAEPHLSRSFPSDIDIVPLIKILGTHFSKGYRLESTLDIKRFHRYYEEMTGVELTLEQNMLETVMQECGIVYAGKIYMPETMLSDEIKTQVLSYIDRCFDEGCVAIYYEALFREFSEKFLDHNIYNAEMLKSYLSYFIGSKYYIGRSYLSKSAHANVDPIDDVRQCLKQYGTPVHIDDVCDSLSHIEEERVRYILGSNGEFVRNSKGEYFHVDSLELTGEELENIANLIASSIEKHEFISGNELYDAIQTKYPYAFEKNAKFSMIGWRDALKYKLDDKFSFMGNIISRAGASLSMSDVFAKYSKEKSSFSLDELNQFADSIGSVIYFDSLYKNVIRISQQWFASKKDIRFSVKETDSVIDRFCIGKYMPLNAIKEYAVFPDAPYPWTEYLLEQYVAFYSEKFYLLHGNFNKNCVVGAIVRKTCLFSSFDELVIDLLVCSNIPLRRSEVLDYLAENGYISRRAYTNIESLIISAQAKRNQKEK